MMSSTGLLRILYVEDHDLVREVTCDLLAHETRLLKAVATAEEALQQFRAEAWDLVITDISLPEMSGLDLVRHLLKIEPALRVIIASGYALDLPLKTWGPNVRYIIKPFEPSDMDAMIAELSNGPVSAAQQVCGQS